MAIEEKVVITADDSGLKKIAKASEAAWSPKMLQAFHKEVTSLVKNLTKTVTEQAALAKGSKEIEKASASYKKLTDQIKAAKEELKKLTTETRDLARVQKAEDRSAALAAAPRRSFMAGALQGVGLGQYIPADPGMWRRAAGMGIGGAVRRGVGGMAAPFTQPGMPGLTGMLGAIPWMGGVMASGLQGGVGMFQETAAFAAARLQNLPYAYLGSSVAERAGHARRSAQIAAAGGAELFGNAAAMPEMRAGALALGGLDVSTVRSQLAAKLQARLPAPTGMQPGRVVEGRGGALMQAGRAPRQGQPALPIAPMGIYTEEQQEQLRVARAALSPANLTDEAYKVVVADDERKKQQFDREWVAKQKKMAANVHARARGALGISTGIPGAGFGAPLGYHAGEVQSAFGQYMGARGGGVGGTEQEALGNLGRFREALAVQRLFGVGVETAGRFERVTRPGGGGEGTAPGALSRTIGIALAQGLAGSQIREYLEQIAQATQAMEQEGVKFDINSMVDSNAMLKASGLAGMQASRVGLGLNASARSVSAQGVQSPMGMLMARAAGWTPEGGPESYFKAMETLEGGMTPEIMAKFFGEISSGTGAIGGSSTAQNFFFRRGMKEAGVSIGSKQAEQLRTSYTAGGMTPQLRSRMQNIISGGEETAEGGFYGRAVKGAGKIGGAAQMSAAMEAARIGAGAAFAPMVKALQNQALAMTDAAKPLVPGLKGLTDAVTTLTKVAAWYMKSTGALDTGLNWMKQGAQLVDKLISQ